MPPNTDRPSANDIGRRRTSSQLSAAEEGTGSVRFLSPPAEMRNVVLDVEMEHPLQNGTQDDDAALAMTERSKHVEHQPTPTAPQNLALSEHSMPPIFIDNIESVASDELDLSEPVSWHDVLTACCCHTSREWMYIGFAVLILLFLLYCFLIGLELLSRSFRVVGGCTAESLLGSDANPMASLMVGILATAVLQSSSTTTAIVVSLVSGGLDVHTAIYIVMGANIGTAITALLVSLAHMGDVDELQRAFAGSSVVWCFKVLTVCVLFPLEVSVQYLFQLTKLMLPSDVGEGEKWEGPIKKIVSPLGNLIIIANTDMMDDIASSGGTLGCEDYYPVECEGGVESFSSCSTGLIACDSKTNNCPAFFQDGASKKDDSISGWVCLIYALVLLIACLVGLVTLLRYMLLGASQRIIYKATNINGYIAMGIGCGATVLVQSSSITISTLVPLVGMGVLGLEQMYPLTLGADIGTTFTALMAAMVSNSVDSLQVALVHLFFNLTGILMWYPIPFMRRIPLNLARRLGRVTRSWRGFPLVFVIVSFLVLPLILLGIAVCFDQGGTGFTALGVFLLLLFGLGILYFLFWWKFQSGKDKFQQCMSTRQRRKTAVNELADDMDYLKVDMEYLKNEIGRLKQYAGLHPEIPSARPPSMHEGDYTQEQAETLSLYESCRSMTWQDILMSSAQSAAGSIGRSLRSPRSSLHTVASNRRVSRSRLDSSRSPPQHARTTSR